MSILLGKLLNNSEIIIDMKIPNRINIFPKILTMGAFLYALSVSAAELKENSIDTQTNKAGKISKTADGFIFEGQESEDYPIFKVVPKDKNDAFDLSDYKYVSLTVKNLSDKEVKFSIWAHSKGGYSGAIWEGKGFCTLKPNEEKPFRIDLETHYPGKDAVSDCVDRSKISSVEIVVDRKGPAKKDSSGRSLYSNSAKLQIKDISPCGEPNAKVNRAALDARYKTPEILPLGTTPKAGLRFFRKLKGYEDTDIVHAVFLPDNWEKGKKYPLIVEYTGNVFYYPSACCYSTGYLTQANLGSAMSRGKDFIVLTLPFVSKDGKREQINAWGSPDLTVEYCLAALKDAEKYFGADPRAYIFTGFSRGEIAANYIALRNDEIAKKWLCLVRVNSNAWPSKWNGAQYGWDERMARLGDRKILNCVSEYGGVHVDTMFNEDNPACIETRKKLVEMVSEAVSKKSEK